jgi:hypothetical protein
MKNRLIAALLTIVAVSVCTFGLPVHAERLYWARNSGDAVPGLENVLASVRTDGSDFVEFYELTDVHLGPVAVDSVSRRLYWVEDDVLPIGSDPALVRGDADHCQRLQVQDAPPGIALDVTGGKIYWTERGIGGGNGRIKRANLDFSSVEPLLVGLNGPSGIGLDLPGGKIYWYDFVDDTILRSNLDGSDVEIQFAVENLVQFQIDSAGQKIYWVQSFLDGLRRADFDGSNVEELAPQVRVPFTVVVSAGTVYWREGSAMSGPPVMIKRADLDGSNEEIVREGLDAAADYLVLDPSDELIPISCDTDVPALGLRGVGLLALLLVVIGARAVMRSSI